MDNEMISKVSKVLMKHVPSLSTVGAAIVAMEFIQAMREPTEKMLSTEGVHTVCYMCGGHKEGWQAMIDAIIND